MTPQAEDSARLHELLGDMYAERVPRADTQSAVIGVVLARMQCARVSMWKFDATDDGMTLLCFASKTAVGVFDTSDRRLRRDEYADYLDRLLATGTYLSDDARSDPVLLPMRASYLVANGVVSLLGAAFVLNNRSYGMVCCEEPSRREWRPADVVALRAIVNKLALLMWNAPDPVLLKTPSTPLRMLAAADTAAPDRRR